MDESEVYGQLYLDFIPLEFEYECDTCQVVLDAIANDGVIGDFGRNVTIQGILDLIPKMKPLVEKYGMDMCQHACQKECELRVLSTRERILPRPRKDGDPSRFPEGSYVFLRPPVSDYDNIKSQSGNSSNCARETCLVVLIEYAFARRFQSHRIFMS